MSWNVIKLRRSTRVVSQATKVPFNYICSLESEYAVTILRALGACSAEFSKKLTSRNLF